MVTELSGGNFDIVTASGAVLVDFWASWCGPCRMVAPIIESLAEEYDGRVSFCKVNVDDEGQLAARFGIESIPTVMIFKDGEVVERAVGVRSRDEYCDMLDKLL